MPGTINVGGQEGIVAAIVTDLGGAVHDAGQRSLQRRPLGCGQSQIRAGQIAVQADKLVFVTADPFRTEQSLCFFQQPGWIRTRQDDDRLR